MTVYSSQSDKYFIYRNIAYDTGTEVSFSNSFIAQHMYNGKPFWKYARFNKRVVVNGRNRYLFFRKPVDWYWMRNNRIPCEVFNATCPFFSLDESMIDDAIEEVIKPIVVTITPLQKLKDYEVEKVMIGWAAYIFVLVFSLVFKEFYLIWIVASMIFFPWRKEMLTR